MFDADPGGGRPPETWESPKGPGPDPEQDCLFAKAIGEGRRKPAHPRRNAFLVCCPCPKCRRVVC